MFVCWFTIQSCLSSFCRPTRTKSWVRPQNKIISHIGDFIIIYLHWAGMYAEDTMLEFSIRKYRQRKCSVTIFISRPQTILKGNCGFSGDIIVKWA